MNSKPTSDTIDPNKFGVSFSIKQCRNFSINPKETFSWLIKEAGFRRFRLMSYWDEHEQEPGKYDFTELDWQIALATQYGCVVTLCLGARQPRWPENHWPNWAWDLPEEGRSAALLKYIQCVVKRYKDEAVIVSYQLENEALLKNFGQRPEVLRPRLRKEYELVKTLDPTRPVIMTTSTSWGIPIRKPIPDHVGFSYYRILYGKKGYSHAFHFPLMHRTRGVLNKLIHGRQSFVHELQLEPWGPKAIWEMPAHEQDKSMSTTIIAKNIALAKKTKLYPVDVWGGEWWYWRLHTHRDPTIWQAVKQAITT